MQKDEPCSGADVLEEDVREYDEARAQYGEETGDASDSTDDIILLQDIVGLQSRSLTHLHHCVSLLAFVTAPPVGGKQDPSDKV